MNSKQNREITVRIGELLALCPVEILGGHTSRGMAPTDTLPTPLQPHADLKDCLPLREVVGSPSECAWLL